MDNNQENRMSFKNDCEYSGFDDSVCKSRRSSILKPPKARAPLLDVNFSNKKDNEDFEGNRKRRVSFAGVNKIKEFNSKVGTIHVSNTPSYDELFSSSSDSSEMLLSETCGYPTKTEDAKTEKEARLILNIISRDDSLFLNESMDITDCSVNENDAKLQDNESKDHLEIDIRNTSSFNPRTFDYLSEKHNDSNCGNYSPKSPNESHNESNPCLNEGMDFTQPILSDKTQESLADMSLEPNLASEISVESTSKEISKQVVYGQPKKTSGPENISPCNQDLKETNFKLDLATCNVLPRNQFDINNDLNNSIDMEFTEAVHRFEDLENNLLEKQKMAAEGEKRVTRKSVVNAFNGNTLDDSCNMEITEACVLRQPENDWCGNTLFTNMRSDKNTPSMEFSDACVLKSSAKISKEDDPPLVRDNYCSFSMELTEAYTVKTAEVNVPYNNSPKSEESSQKKSVDTPIGTISPHENISTQDFNCSSMDLTETNVNKITQDMPVVNPRASILKDAPETIFSSKIEFTKANIVELSEEKRIRKSVSAHNEDYTSNMDITGICSVNPPQNASEGVNAKTVPVNEFLTTSNMEFTDACSPKTFHKFKTDFLFNDKESALDKSTEPLLTMGSDCRNPIVPNFKDRELNCSMELTEVCIPKASEKSTNFFKNNEQNPISSNMEITEICILNPGVVTRNSLPMKKSHECSSNMEFTEAYVNKLPDVSRSSMPFTKNRELSSDMELTEAYVNDPSNAVRNSLPFMKQHALTTNMELTKACEVIPSITIPNSSPSTKGCELSSRMEFTEAIVPKPPDLTNVSLPITNNRKLTSSMELTEACVVISPSNAARNSRSFNKEHMDSTNMEPTQSWEAIPVGKRNSFTKDSKLSSSMEFTEAYVPKPAEVTKGSLTITKSRELLSSMEFTEAYIPKPAEVTKDSLTITKSRELSSNMEFTEAGISNSSNAERNSLPVIKDSELPSNIGHIEECVANPPNLTRSPSPFTKSQECSQSDQITTRSSIKEITDDLLQDQQETSNFTNRTPLEPQKQQRTILHDSVVNKNCFNDNDITPTFEEKHNGSRSKYTPEDTAYKLEKKDSGTMKNISKENEISFHLPSIPQDPHISDLHISPAEDKSAVSQNDCFHPYLMNSAEQRHPVPPIKLPDEEIIEAESVQVQELKFSAAESIIDNPPPLVNPEAAKSRLQNGDETIEDNGKSTAKTDAELLTRSNFVEIKETNGDLLEDQLGTSNSGALCESQKSQHFESQKLCDSVNSSVAEGNGSGTNEEIIFPQKDKQHPILNSDSASISTLETHKNIEGENIYSCNENEDKPSERCAVDFVKDRTVVRKCMQAVPSFSFQTNSFRKSRAPWEETFQKEGASFSSSYVQSLEFRGGSMEQFKLNIQNLQFMNNLGFSRISFTKWRYTLTETLSIVFEVPSGRIDKSTCLMKVHYDLDKNADSINLYITEIITKRYAEEWLKSVCATVKDVLQTSDIIMKERFEMKKFYRTLNYLHRFYPCKFNKNSISFYIVNIKAHIKFDVVIYFDGWKKIKADDIKVVNEIGHIREQLVRSLFVSITEDEKRLINFVKMLEDYCKYQNKDI